METVTDRAVEALNGLAEIVHRVRETQDVSRFQSDLGRWKVRAVDSLSEVLPARDLAEFRQLSIKPSWVRMEDPVRPIVDRHRAFLEAVAEDAAQHPEAYERRMKQDRVRPHVQKSPTSTPAAVPDRVTLQWLFTHVPVRTWFGLLIVVLAAFAFGVKVGATPELARIVAPLVGADVPAPAP